MSMFSREDDMAKPISPRKLAKLDHLMHHLEQSPMFTRLLEKVATAFGAKPQIQIKEKLVEKIVEKPVDRIVEKEKKVEVTPKWAKSLEEYQRLLVTVQQHPVLSDVLLPHVKGGDELVTLLANLAQWDNVERIWEELAAQAAQGRDIRTDEHELLAASLRLYNRTLRDHQASFSDVQVGEAYDYNVHRRINEKGSSIAQLLLPGLVNAGGQLCKRTLVRTV